jgi:hypothetical protein
MDHDGISDIAVNRSCDRLKAGAFIYEEIALEPKIPSVRGER